MPRPLQEQAVVITGASTGIGRQTAIAFARRRAALILAARSVPYQAAYCAAKHGIKGFTEAFRQQRADQPDDGRDNLFAPMSQPRTVHGEFGERSYASSPYTRYLEVHPFLTGGLVAAGAILAAASLIRRR